MPPQCATLNPAPPFGSIFGSQTTFNWVTSAAHLTCHPDYYFYFRIKDNYCPAPAVNYRTVKITVLPQPCTIGISEEEAGIQALNIFPNPAGEFAVISYPFSVGDEIHLVDVSGRVLFSKTILSPATSYKLQTTSCAPGVYFFNLVNEKTGEKMNGKIVVSE